MKKYVMLAFAVMLSIGMFLTAQNQRPPRGERGPHMGMRLTPQERADTLAVQLNLTSDQKTKVEAFFEKQDKQMQEMRKSRQNSNMSREEMRKEFQAMRISNDSALTAIIGKEKFEKFQQMRRERMNRMRNGRGNWGGGRPQRDQ